MSTDIETTVTITDSNMRLLWVSSETDGVASLLQTLGAAVLAVEEQVIDLWFNVSDDGVITLGAYLEREL